MRKTSHTLLDFTHAQNESVVRPCSTGAKTTDASCFTNNACYTENSISLATGQLQWQDLSSYPYKQNVSKERWGTAFFISPSLLMTAGHCFDTLAGGKGWYTPHDGQGNYLSPQEFAPLLQLNMNYQYQTCTSMVFGDKPEENEISFPVTKLAEHRNGGLDYAIIEVRGYEGHNFPSVKFDFSFTQGEVFIPQHPDGEPKMREFGEAKVSSNRSILFHNVNTKGGSSGSPMATLNILACGVHVQGDNGDRLNKAVNVASILQKSPILQGFFRLQNPSIPKEPKVSSSSHLVAQEKSEEVNWELLVALTTAVISGYGALHLAQKNRCRNSVAFGVVSGVLVGVLVLLILKNKRFLNESAKPSNAVSLVADEEIQPRRFRP